MLAAQQDNWERDSGEADLQIILEHRPALVVSEKILVALLRADAPVAQDWKWDSLLRFVLKRSDCGITKEVLRTVSDRNTWKILHEHYQEGQAAYRPVLGERLARNRRTSRDNPMDDSPKQLCSG